MDLQRVATGLYSHWDSVIKVDKKTMEWIKSSKKKKPRRNISSLEEAAYTLDQAAKNGGREFLISKKVFNDLKKLFPKRDKRLGGNGNNMGSALLHFGVKPLVSYPTRPKELMNASPDFFVALNGKAVKPVSAIRKDPEYEHLVFEFENDRHILSWDKMTSHGIFDIDFLEMACDTRKTDLLIFAYAHLLLPKFKSRTDIIVDALKGKRPKVHLELGTGCRESMSHAIDSLSENGCCDSFGMNGRECMLYFKAASNNKEDLIEACLNADYDVNMCVHNPLFAFSVSKNEPKKELKALKTAFAFSSGMSNTTLIKSSTERSGKHVICIVETEKPQNLKILTGLGDNFAALQAFKSLL